MSRLIRAYSKRPGLGLAQSGPIEKSLRNERVKVTPEFLRASFL